MDFLVTPSAPASSPAARYLTVRQVRHRADVEVCIASGEIDLYTVSLVREALWDTEQRRVPRVRPRL